jgi:hypothetical protein
MAIETEPRRETVTVEPNGHRTSVRLHEEILPPTLGPSTPASLRRARRALAILGVGVILVQLISAPIGHRLNSVARSGTDVYSEWQKYASNPVPDVLVIGASPARTDIDEAGLSAELSTASGRPVTVEKLGFAGDGPLFLDALMYRIMKRQPHPKLIVVALVGPDLNDGCTACLASVTGGLWDISDLTDPDFVRLALHLDPNPTRLVTGWVFPAFAYYPSVVALHCLAVDYGRAGAIAVLGRVPVQLQKPTICEVTAAYKWARQTAMTESDYQGSIDQYRGFMLDYRVSPETVSSVTDMVTRARADGTNVVFLETPLHSGVRSLFPGAIQTYQHELHILASSLNTGVVDLSDSVPDDPTLWVDVVHLDRAGAHYFAPQLAHQLFPYLPSG